MDLFWGPLNWMQWLPSPLDSLLIPCPIVNYINETPKIASYIYTSK
jgi:hypothetical protein